MLVLEKEIIDGWCELKIRSEASGNEYTVSLAWYIDPGKWLAYNCTCEGFSFRKYCSHSKSSEEYMKSEPGPERKRTGELLVLGSCYQCSICKSMAFIVKADGTGIICDRCGRLHGLVKHDTE